MVQPVPYILGAFNAHRNNRLNKKKRKEKKKLHDNNSATTIEQNKAHPTIIRKNKLMVAPSNSNVTNSKN